MTMLAADDAADVDVDVAAAEEGRRKDPTNDVKSESKLKPFSGQSLQLEVSWQLDVGSYG